MPCSQCQRTIKEYDKYYNSSGIINLFLCKTCNKCTLCHINDNSSHLIEWDKYNFDEKLNIHTIGIERKSSNIFTDNWR